MLPSNYRNIWGMNTNAVIPVVIATEFSHETSLTIVSTKSLASTTQGSNIYRRCSNLIILHKTTKSVLVKVDICISAWGPFFACSVSCEKFTVTKTYTLD